MKKKLNTICNDKKSNCTKGITLISLVITIIILIILAGITINLTLGENGIFNKAKYAKQEYLNAQASEEEKINDLYSEMMIATNDSSQITISMEDLNKIIDARIEEKTASLQTQITTLKGSLDNVGEIYTKENTISIGTTQATWVDVSSATWTIPEGTWIIDIWFCDRPIGSSGLFAFEIAELGINDGFWKTDANTPNTHFSCIKTYTKETTGKFRYFQSITDAVSRDLTVYMKAVRIK